MAEAEDCFCHDQRLKRRQRIQQIQAIEEDAGPLQVEVDPGLLQTDQLLSIQRGAVVSLPCEEPRCMDSSTMTGVKRKRKVDGTLGRQIDFTPAETNQYIKDKEKFEFEKFKDIQIKDGKDEDEDEMIEKDKIRQS